jgi:hypothetical protein
MQPAIKPDLTRPSSRLDGRSRTMPAMDTTTPTPEPDETPRDETALPDDAAFTPREDVAPPRRRRFLAVAGLAVALPAIGLISYGVTTTAGADDTADPADAVEGELLDGECAEEWVPTPEDVETLNAEADSLTAFFEARHIEHTIETDEHGVRWVVWDEADEAANQAWDEWAAEYYPEDEDVTADIQADEDALAAYLDEHGIAYTREAGADGVNYVVTGEDDAAADQAIEDFWSQYYGEASESCGSVEVEENGEVVALEASVVFEGEDVEG